MFDTAASFDDVTLFGGREFAFGDARGLLGRVLGSAAMGIAAVAAVGACAATVAVTGLWMVGVTLSDAPHVKTRRPAGPARLALADPAAFPKSSFEARWARTTALVPVSARVSARSVETAVADAGRDIAAPTVASRPHLNVADEIATAPAAVDVAELTPPAARETPAPIAEHTVLVPLPQPKPDLPRIARTPAEPAAPQAAALAPGAPDSEPKAAVPAGADGRTALYDIAGQTVYMPDGERLEAHSGFGHRRDNPRYIKVKNLGPTPPNVYTLTLRKRLFHGVRAVRMTPVAGSRMFGRDGMLAHSYMLGSSGQSNGCVSFKNYDRFLQAYLKGKVDRIVVVRNLDETPQQLASLVRRDSGGGNRFAANEITGSTW
jgi:hypothetical protein